MGKLSVMLVIGILSTGVMMVLGLYDYLVNMGLLTLPTQALEREQEA